MSPIEIRTRYLITAAEAAKVTATATLAIVNPVVVAAAAAITLPCVRSAMTAGRLTVWSKFLPAYAPGAQGAVSYRRAIFPSVSTV